MTKIITLAVASAMMATSAFAGSLAPVQDERAPVVDVFEAAPSSGGLAVPIIAGVVGLALIAAIASGDDDDAAGTTDPVLK